MGVLVGVEHLGQLAVLAHDVIVAGIPGQVEDGVVVRLAFIFIHSGSWFEVG